MNRSHLTLLVAASLMLTVVSHAVIYKCVAADGIIEFQQTPCDKNKSKEEIVSSKKSATSNGAINTATYAQTISIYPGAKLLSKDIEPGYYEALEYKSSADFKNIVEYYERQAGKENCEFLQKDNFNCAYKKVIGHGSGDVYIHERADDVLISIMKHPN